MKAVYSCEELHHDSSQRLHGDLECNTTFYKYSHEDRLSLLELKWALKQFLGKDILLGSLFVRFTKALIWNLGLVGLTLFLINLVGVLTPLRSPALATAHTFFGPGDLTLSAQEVRQLATRRRDESPRALVERATYAVNNGMAHDWTQGAYNLHIPITNNWILWLWGVIDPRFQLWEFMDDQRALERGVGLCSQHAIVLNGLLHAQGVRSEIVSLGSLHVVNRVEVTENEWMIADSDLGLILPDLPAISPDLIRSYYPDPTYYIQAYQSPIRISTDSQTYNPQATLIEIWTYRLKWILPLLMMAFFAAIRLWSARRRSRITGGTLTPLGRSDLSRSAEAQDISVQPMEKLTLHIGIVARALSHEFGGVREYTEALIQELLALHSPHRFTLYYRDPALLGSHPEATEVVLRAPHKFIWDHVVLPLRLAHDCPDVVWFPQNNTSLGLSCPTVVSVTDLLYFKISEFPYREYAWPDTLYARCLMPRSLRQASRVMTISDHTAHDCQRLMDIPAAKMRTIYLAPAKRFHPIPPEVCADVRARFRLERPFFFYAGVLSPRKNIRTLIEAFGKIAADVPHDLVLTGGSGMREVPIDDLINRYQIQQRVHRLGKVASDQLVALYNLADAFIFPSLYEGFGIPPLEAMACGCPVISSAATSLAEVVGNAALIFDPLDTEQLAAHMKAITSDADVRRRLVAAGLQRVALFNYHHSAQQLLALLEEAAHDLL